MEELLASSNSQKRDYIPWLFASAPVTGLPERMINLRQALQGKALLDGVLQRAEAMRPGIVSRHLQQQAEVAEQLEQGQLVTKTS